MANQLLLEHCENILDIQCKCRHRKLFDGLLCSEKIENPLADDSEEVIADAFTALLASYNLQFEGLLLNVL